ncbi:DHHW family protein [Aminipila luticellarii]|uniref:DHHW protein n=1 Tax=Aminipila luticellarii TaxID=2507160 RepID=A0A410PX51_9FIRM|nr:DHHW family protein [Aminipila luticellarii]QAT43527.1 hypothetical protein EQM06_10025 [Aminipila luticellarii]
MRDKKAAVTGIGFVLILSCLLVLCGMIPDKAFSDNENRQLQSLPKWKISDVASGAYMKNFEAYASDQVIGRDGWVKIKNIADIVSGKKDNGSAYFGKDGYLFPMDTIDENQFKKNSDYAKTFIEKVKGMNRKINISVILAPTSQEIYKDKMPPYAPESDQGKVLKEAEECFGEMLVNPGAALSQHKNEYIYYKTDHHWTTLGAYYTYRIWAEQNQLEPLDKKDFDIETVNRNFYGTTYSKAAGYPAEPDSIQKFTNNAIEHTGMKIESLKGVKEFPSLYNEQYLNTKDKYSYFLSGNNPMTTIKGTATNGQNILVIKDSYANCFVPFITAHFQNIYVADLRYYKQSLQQFVKENNITDVLFLYNIVQYSNDRNLVYLLKE